ncbi:MAG: ATP-binding protein, partial [Bacteroidales bacterium]|nr:ATP-binding protein [Bacteroidales bacterium]
RLGLMCIRDSFPTRRAGAGLGLSICRKLAESMNARISLDEDEPAPARKGARFRVEFVKITPPEK